MNAIDWEENNEEFEVDRSGEDMEIINEIKSGRFDVDAPEKVGTEEWWHKHYGAEWPEMGGD